MLKYEKFRQTIRQVIQQSELDVGVVYFILKDIIHELEPLYLQQIQQEAKEEQILDKSTHQEVD